MKIVYVVNEASFFLSHRLWLAREAIDRGANVVLICGENTGEHKLEEHGIDYLTVPMSRSGANPFVELRTFLKLLSLYKRLAPDLVHHVTIKPVLYGTVAARIAGVSAVVNAIPGMGFVFTRRGNRARLRRWLVFQLYRFAVSHPNMRVIFQNREDRGSFLANSIVLPEQVVLIRGSGVDLEEFEATAEPATKDIVFVLIARMLRDKGVGEFVEAAKRLRSNYPHWNFWLVGDVDPGNPTSLTVDELMAWDNEGVIHWLGQREDVSEVLKLSHVVVLPSYYREGLPKTLLEAAASQRAMIASRVAGCLEVVTDGVTGLIVEPRDVEDLATTMVRMGNDAGLRTRLGRAARSKAEAVFRVEDVVRDTFVVYQQLLRRPLSPSEHAEAIREQSH